ncbi:phytanoyl-CoA dioxygenase [bacterium]|nr:MAG: phytanoyl-CoA dioxygenase [bacterium]
MNTMFERPMTLTSSGETLDLSPDYFGELLDSSDVLHDMSVLRERMERDGYLYLPAMLDRAEVLDARRAIATQLAEAGHFLPYSDPMECLAVPGGNGAFIPKIAMQTPELLRVLYGETMMDFWAQFLGEPARHFDFTWFRATAPGRATPPHTDAVYMNRGTQNLFTCWTPIGDVPLEHGGLMMLEGSHLHDKLRQNYSSKDVDSVCENLRPDLKTSRQNMMKSGVFGALSSRPAKLRDALGGRWLTTNYSAGDILIFSIYTVHCSLDNTSNRVRLTSDSRYQRASEPADERWVGENPIGHGEAAKRTLIC